MSNEVKPVILNETDAIALIDNGQAELIDLYDFQLKELARINNPSDPSPSVERVESVWVHYARLSKVVHCVGSEDYYKLRTNRNKNLITQEEQEKLRHFSVGVCGMSVGAGIAHALRYTGVSETIKIADFDTVDSSNLNRLRATLLDVGRPKTEVAAQAIYELDPFCRVITYSGGLTDENLDEFFLDPAINLVIDEIDDFKMKVKLRLAAKKHRIPLLMFTSLGDNILVDVERYDIDDNQMPFNGLLADNGQDILAKDIITPEDIRNYSVQLVGKQYIPDRALQSVAEMGKTLVGRPQLYSTIAVDGGLAAYITRQIALGSDISAGRYFIEFDELVRAV